LEHESEVSRYKNTKKPCHKRCMPDAAGVVLRKIKM
jgi:hypothetical protein